MTQSRPPQPPRQPGVHRRDDRGNRFAVLVASLIGIAIAATLIAFALHERGEPAHERTAAPASRTSASPESVGLPAGSFTTGPSSTQPGIAAVTTSAPPATPATTPATVAPAPTAASASPTIASVRAPALDVLNDSRITGLAHRASKEFSAAGWSVSAIGNFTDDPDVPATTIFYPDGEKAAADHLAAAFGVARVLRAPADLSNAHLTVVLARDWPDSAG